MACKKNAKKTKKCPACGQKIKNSSKVCPECGEKLEKEAE